MLKEEKGTFLNTKQLFQFYQHCFIAFNIQLNAFFIINISSRQNYFVTKVIYKNS